MCSGQPFDKISGRTVLNTLNKTSIDKNWSRVANVLIYFRFRLENLHLCPASCTIPMSY